MTQLAKLEHRLAAAEQRTRSLSSRYRELKSQFLERELEHNRSLAHLHDLLEGGGTALAIDYLEEQLERTAAWAVDRLLEEIAADPPPVWDGVGVKVFADE